MRAYLLNAPPQDAFEHMALDEATLEYAGRGESPRSYLRIYQWAGARPYGLTFGYSQAYEDVAAVVRERFGGVTLPLVRRSTGGGIVYHDGDVTFSFVFPWPTLSTPDSIYKGIHFGVHLGLKLKNIPSRLWSPVAAGGAVREECFSGPEPKDLVHEDGTKFLGGALRRRKGYGLYQGSMRMERFPEREKDVQAALVEGFGLQWRFLLEPTALPAELAAGAQRLRIEKYTQESWNKKR